MDHGFSADHRRRIVCAHFGPSRIGERRVVGKCAIGPLRIRWISVCASIIRALVHRIKETFRGAPSQPVLWRQTILIGSLGWIGRGLEVISGRSSPQCGGVRQQRGSDHQSQRYRVFDINQQPCSWTDPHRPMNRQRSAHLKAQNKGSRAGSTCNQVSTDRKSIFLALSRPEATECRADASNLTRTATKWRIWERPLTSEKRGKGMFGRGIKPKSCLSFPCPSFLCP